MKLVANRKVSSFDGINSSIIELYYSLLSNKVGDNVIYGLKVSSFIDGDIEDVSQVQDITSNKHWAKYIFEKCVENLVTPISLIYILEDFVGDI